jgi:hypothetical protein
LTSHSDKAQAAVKIVIESIGEPAALELAKLFKERCGLDIDEIETTTDLECFKETLRAKYGKAADLLIQLLP